MIKLTKITRAIISFLTHTACLFFIKHQYCRVSAFTVPTYTIYNLVFNKLFTCIQNLISKHFDYYTSSFLQRSINIEDGSHFHLIVVQLHVLLCNHKNIILGFLSGILLLSFSLPNHIFTTTLWNLYLLILGFVCILDFSYSYLKENTIKIKYPLLDLFITIVLAICLIIIAYLILENINTLLDITMHVISKIITDFIYKMMSFSPRPSNPSGPGPVGGGGEDPGKRPGGKPGPFGCGSDKSTDYDSASDEDSQGNSNTNNKNNEPKKGTRFKYTGGAEPGVAEQWEIEEEKREKQASYRASHKEEKAAYDAAYNASHKEEKAAYDAAYSASHKQEKAAYNAEYNANHKQEKHDYNAAYKASHKDQTAAYDAEYNANHKQERHDYNAAYYASHKEEIKARNASRKNEKAPYNPAYNDSHNEEKAAYDAVYNASPAGIARTARASAKRKANNEAKKLEKQKKK